ncbi:MAG: S9 family peptidase [Rikenellaceae bacterium]|nr:S9 family peptidase [Rikenellaceae bacterium]
MAVSESPADTVGGPATAVCEPAVPRFGYEEIARGDFWPRTVRGVRSMSDGEHYTSVTNGHIVRYRFATGEAVDTLYSAVAVQPAVYPEGYVFSDDERRILLRTDVEPIYRHSFTADYYVYDRETGQIAPLSDAGPQEQAAFSPDGERVAFVRGNDLFVRELATGAERRLTHDGKFGEIINGKPDWVYEEEFGFARAFEWAPDSRRIAWMRFDERGVREYPMNRFDGSLYPTVYSFKYPKAGERNSAVEVWTYDLDTDSAARVDVGPEADQYIPRIRWTPRGELAVYRLNRRQNRFEVVVNGRVVYEETDPRYVERVDDGTIRFLPDGDRFIVRSERDGFMHLYLYSQSRGLLGPITAGDWEVTELLDVVGDRVYYLSNEDAPLGRGLWSVRLDGRKKTRLTPQGGTYDIVPSEGFRYYLSYHTDASTPLVVTLHRGDGRLLRTLEDNAALRARADSLRLPRREFFTFTTPGGVELNGYLLRPEGFDPTHRYPVLMTQYSGPGSQSVADSWGVDWEDVLVQQGYVVACVDGRGTGLRGADFKKCTYRELGRYETEDQIAAARYLASQPWVDPERIGIYGWSYGGFMALNCILRGNDVFKMAIAVAPVTNWRYYDTIYTELYNGLPQDNAAGYDDNSPVNFADRLRGRLLIVHGTGDDNVHVQNSYEMASALVRAGKSFDLMIYPDCNHGMWPAGGRHVMDLLIDYTLKNL